MDEILAATFSHAVYGRLDYLDTLVDKADERSLSALANTEITRLTDTLRDMLAQHRPDESGRCRQCSGWFRHRAHPCSVWTVAHEHLVAAGGASSVGTGRHTPADGRPSVAMLRFS